MTTIYSSRELIDEDLDFRDKVRQSFLQLKGKEEKEAEGLK